MSELRGLGAVHDELQRRGGRLLAVSVDPPAQSREVVRRLRLRFAILSDAERRVTQDYGVLHVGGGEHGDDIALPAMFLLDREGWIVWRRIAARIQDRPDPQSVIEIIRTRLGS